MVDTSTGDSDRVDWSELANLIGESFDVSHREASKMADRALRDERYLQAEEDQ